MKQIVTQGIVLNRTNFAEADRILTMLTPDQGKVRVLAKGVRKERSKLAGGIELFSVSNISFIPGRKEIGTLTSTRLATYYANITKEIERTVAGYDLLKKLNRATEDAAGREYFDLLKSTLEGLNDLGLDKSLLTIWFDANLLKLAGHQLELKKDAPGKELEPNQTYLFDYENMKLLPHARGTVTANHIKFLRLLFGLNSPVGLKQVKNSQVVLPISQQIITVSLGQFIRL